MSRQMRILCGVPQEHCTGGILQTDQQLGTNRCHTNREDAMKCKSKYLISQGYERLSSRTFRSPDNGSILVLPKRTKFGGKLRSGKGEQGARFEPKRGSGLIF